MHRTSHIAIAAAFFAVAPSLHAQAAERPAPLDTLRNPEIQQMVARLDLEKYKATIKGLTQFGDRRQGTARNRAAVDWIEAQLKSYGCTNTERITYTYTTPQRGGARGGGRGAGGDTTGRGARGGGAGAGAGRSDWVRVARAVAAFARAPA